MVNGQWSMVNGQWSKNESALQAMLMKTTVTIKSPATIANLVCGFDVLGLALNEPYDMMQVSRSDLAGVRIKHTDHFNLPTEAASNVAGVALLALLKEADTNIGFDLTIEKHIKPGSGLGSSAASAAGAVVAANHLLGDKFCKEDLVRFALAGEKLASGVEHADNISPCIYGGVTLIRSTTPLDIISLSAPPMYVVVVHPQIELKTSDAREILRKEVTLKDAIRQWGNVGGLVAGLAQGDYSLISRSLEDVIIEPVRSILIPGFAEVKKQCAYAGALGGGIAGSGPSIFMLCKEESTAKDIEIIMQKVYSGIGLPCLTYVTTINTKGITFCESI